MLFHTLLLIAESLISFMVGIYFFYMLRSQRDNKNALRKESMRELEKLHRMRGIKLTTPLSEKTRPASFSEIHGQSEGLKALRAALCGTNPQHVLIYGPPGVGKTAAARAALSEAAHLPQSPFTKSSPFVELDAATLRYDERGIADPLIGSVHDPIYQGAGAYGPGGIPQPKFGAVTHAHGGILFLDEIGELPSTQLNKLLKVLEDRRVLPESAYYSRDNKEIPRHIHDIFQNGMPADFRLVGATTRSPEELPAALRSRCAEIFFTALSNTDLLEIARGAVKKSGFSATDAALEAAVQYASNGRDIVNILQTAGSVAQCEGRAQITPGDVLWVAEAGRYAPHREVRCLGQARVGVVHGLAVAGLAGGFLADIEAVATYEKGGGSLTLTGIVEEESVSAGARQLMRTGSTKASVINAVRVLETVCDFRPLDWRLHVNFPGGAITDGPSAGIAIFAALYSAITGYAIPDTVALTGELTPKGSVLPVGGIPQKLLAAHAAGIKTVLLPAENDVPNTPLCTVSISSVSALLKELFPSVAAIKEETPSPNLCAVQSAAVFKA